MDFTIITLGDIETFRATLTAIAMLFNPSNTTDFVGTSDIGLGGFAGVGLLIALTVALFKGVSTLKFELGELAVVIILYSAMFVPKFDVILVDYYSGDVAAVDDVPLGIALPGAFISGFTTQISESLSTAFKTASSPAYAMQENGFVYPLKLLNALKKGSGQFAKTQPEISTSLINIYKDCAFGREGFSSTKMARSDNPWVYLKDYIENKSVTGLTEIYDATTPEGRVVTCLESASAIDTNINDLFKPGLNPDIPVSAKNPGGVSKFEEMICANMKNVRTKNKGCPDYAEYEAAFQVVGAAAGESAKNFAITTMVASSVKNAELCAAGATSAASIAQCMPMVTALEQYKEDAVGGATMFQKTMLNSMSVMLFLFYAFAPLVSVLMIVMGAKGIKLLGSYMMFGVWTQSWLPFATVLNFYIQQKVNADSARFGINSPELTAAGYQAFYESVSINLAIASDLMAATPLITLALISGSIFALTGVANRLSGRDYYDEKVNAPTAIQQGAISMNTPSFSGASGFMSAKSNDVKAPAINFGSAMQNSTQYAESVTASNAVQVQKSIERTFLESYKQTGSVEKSVQLAKDKGVYTEEGVGAALRAIADNKDGTSSDSQVAAAKAESKAHQVKYEAAASLKAQGYFGTPGGDGAMVGARIVGEIGTSAAAAGITVDQTGITKTDSNKRAIGQNATISGTGNYDQSTAMREALAVKNSIAVAQNYQRSVDANDTKKEGETLTQMAANQEQAIKMASLTQTLGTQTTLDAPQLVGALNNNPSLSGAIMSAGNKHLGDKDFAERYYATVNALDKTDARTTRDVNGNNVVEEMAMLQTMADLRPKEAVGIISQAFNPALSAEGVTNPTSRANELFTNVQAIAGKDVVTPDTTAAIINNGVAAAQPQRDGVKTATNIIPKTVNPELPTTNPAEVVNPAATGRILGAEYAAQVENTRNIINDVVATPANNFGGAQRDLAGKYDEFKEQHRTTLADLAPSQKDRDQAVKDEALVSAYIAKQAAHPDYIGSSEHADDKRAAIQAQQRQTATAERSAAQFDPTSPNAKILTSFAAGSRAFTTAMDSPEANTPLRIFAPPPVGGENAVDPNAGAAFKAYKKKLEKQAVSKETLENLGEGLKAPPLNKK